MHKRLCKIDKEVKKRMYSMWGRLHKLFLKYENKRSIAGRFAGSASNLRGVRSVVA